MEDYKDKNTLHQAINHLLKNYNTKEFIIDFKIDFNCDVDEDFDFEIFCQDIFV